ncbi:FRG domain-containing protein [Shewanella sp. 3_MG-2023]|uniref:FRG domain-containing protein n=1 Tax=Shewanella sp. 3_MG-2023 TaxID=3062635 RepID=UPI0026E1ED6A|nr:FRG domain-containing protein [Shewanella sp. 3_MG-2023]MDO6777122.1 FRG domain-containing protein [Shewanella sp. 3_MG-2023]
MIILDIKESKLGSVKTLMGLLPSLSEPGYTIFYRGHNDKKFELTPSIYRKNEWFTNESKIIREIIGRCPNEFQHMKTSFEKLVKMQHYDLPTRLLDVTENPLVALYFACLSKENEPDKDGELLLFKVPNKLIRYYDSDRVTILSNLAWSDNNFEVLGKHNNSNSFHKKDNEHAIKLMHNIRQEKPHFTENINPSDLSSVVCVKPKMDNQRVIRQDGAFLLFGIDGNKHKPASIDKEWKYNPENKKYIINHNDKATILKQLESIGISKAKLFPEIDMVSQFIKDTYDLEKNDFNSTYRRPTRLNIGF